MARQDLPDAADDGGKIEVVQDGQWCIAAIGLA